MKFSSDIAEVIARAAAVGIDRLVTIADSLPEGQECLQIAEQYDQIFCTIGVHPHNASSWDKRSAMRLRELATSSNTVVAIGEIGLDYHYMNAPKEDQMRAFREQLQIANDLSLPVVVHNRESIGDLLPIVADLQPKKLVLHCNTEKWEDCSELIEMGYLFGFTGIATYPKSEEVRRTIQRCPLEHMMIETDAPYLAPQSQRGKRNEPAFLKETAELIADIKGISLEEFDAITTKNTEEFYGLRV